MESSISFALETALDLGKLTTTGSVLHINYDYHGNEEHGSEPDKKPDELIGHPVKTFSTFEQDMVAVDDHGFVKKKILEEGGGLPIDESFTVSIAFSGYWENESEPFDVTTIRKPMVVDINDNGLLPGLQIAVQSMLVGEMSAFLLSHQVMYGELGVPPRIKPMATCLFYIKLLKSVITPKERKSLSQPHTFQDIHKEVKMLYSSGVTLNQAKNITGAIRLFRKAVAMMYKCHLADEEEEAIQEKLLIKIYINLAVCYNKVKLPLKACIACNELQRLKSLHNNAKALFQNAKALRMIGEFDLAEKKLKRAKKLKPDQKEIDDELQVLQRTRKACNQDKLIRSITTNSMVPLIDDNFKQEVDELIKNFKENPNLYKLTLPEGLNSHERAYVKEASIRENLFFNLKKRSVPDSGEKYLLEKGDDDALSSVINDD